MNFSLCYKMKPLKVLFKRFPFQIKFMVHVLIDAACRALLKKINLCTVILSVM